MNPNLPPPVVSILLVTCFTSGIGIRGMAQDGAAPSAKSGVSGSALEAVSASRKGQASKVGASPGKPADGAAAVSGPAAFPGMTALDDPAVSDPRFVVPPKTKGKPAVPRLAKIDLDGDLDYDGTINPDSPSTQGAAESVPPGLQIGTGELTRLLIRFKTYQSQFPGSLVVSLEVSGISRDSASGAVEAGGASVGRIRVWRDPQRKELLVDSGDKGNLRHEWRYDSGKLAGGIPRAIYVEGVKTSPKFEGDLRLLVAANHVAEGAGAGTPSSLFQSAFDHILLTVRGEPVEKDFINNNAEAVWSTVGGPAKEPEAAPAEAR
jgi:hypothetical protein